MTVVGFRRVGWNVVLALLVTGLTGHWYYRTTRSLQESASVATLDQVSVPVWAYCERGV